MPQPMPTDSHVERVCVHGRAASPQLVPSTTAVDSCPHCWRAKPEGSEAGMPLPAPMTTSTLRGHIPFRGECHFDANAGQYNLFGEHQEGTFCRYPRGEHMFGTGHPNR